MSRYTGQRGQGLSTTWYHGICECMVLCTHSLLKWSRWKECQNNLLLTFLLNIRTIFTLWRILNCPRTTLNTWKTWWSAALIEIESKPLYLNFLIIPPRTKLWSVYCTIHQVRTRNWAPSVLLVDTVDNFPVNITSATDDIPHMNLMYESYSISILCQSNCTF